MGARRAARRPSNPIGWLFAVALQLEDVRDTDHVYEVQETNSERTAPEQ